ncbi:hypothetical protein FNU79_18360 [Deinococcus detaillensis]|uniref:Uncharacterized protein n=1 Tax=Deinococcus detaillensis TaxID=2592048 RepID=A0A553UGC8_9DEIO|nr:hypothetical protein FNU79_18360 [Deinococcus detaillensis]
MNRPLISTVLILSLSFAAGSPSLASPVLDSAPQAGFGFTALSVNLQPTTADMGAPSQLNRGLAGAVKRIPHNPPTC